MNRAFHHTYGLLWRGDVDWIADDIRAVLVRGSLYAFLASDQFLADIPAGARAADVALTGRDEIAGAVFADDATWPTVPVGDDVTAVVIYAETEDEATSPLLLWLDELDGLPRPTGGTDITLTWPGSGIAGLVDGAVEFPTPPPPTVEERSEAVIYTKDTSDIAPPAWATHVLLDGIGAGGGGGGGRSSPSAITAIGGAGGAAGDRVSRLVPVSALTGDLSVVLGAGGPGGTGSTGTANQNGTSGTAGGDTVISDGAGALLTAKGGIAGVGGQTTGVAFPAQVGTTGPAGGSPVNGTGHPGISTAVGVAGPGAGASGGRAQFQNSGGAGGDGNGAATRNGGDGGTALGFNGDHGNAAPDTEWSGGGGGGGGAGRDGTTTNAGDGGDGGEPGGGGGGGGALRNGSSNRAGHGGAGGDGRARITWIGFEVVE
ncbi:MAG TPA: hypothetical protein PKZ76_13610 [Xanthomonadaceae bacterium]|nr:hypothetical protein [Xanthomonadaceae bacterium]